MSFKVHLEQKDSLAEKYKSHDAYEFLRGGVLCVHRQNGKRIYYAPDHWRYVEADDDHPPRSS
ncbi:hypothetical protein [Mycobacterium sp. 1274756.6]|uniref:hypothetical protein n=1 Tax=Mycobacterium sp. 1274756.6 TaxID=1834076 RepID=UPI0007FC66EB|nr:hypothetical protein [Mycobacterium sp. 1274756.6]OBJ71028.1 hypothetical protein A5643_09080 [Mycobacterium sp. 1274756.6]